MKQLPEHGPCFVCGSQNPHNFGVRWHAREDGVIFTEVTLTRAQQGPPGHVHGGALAALLDEIMGTAVWNSGHMVLAANLNVDFRRPVPLGVPLQLKGEVTDRQGRKIFARAEIRLPDGEIAAVGRGLFIESEELFTARGPSGFLQWLPDEA